MPSWRTFPAHVACSLLALLARAETLSAQPVSNCDDSVIFGTMTFSQIGGIQRHVEAADLNGDGHVDLVISGPTSITIALGAPTAAGLYEYSTIGVYSGYPDPTGTAIGDFNGDGIPDIAVACDGSSGGLYLFRGEGQNGVGTGQFVQYASLPTNNVWDVATADLNGDGIADLVAGGRYRSVFSFLGSGSNGVGDGSFVSAGAFGVPASCKGMQLADLDLDGILDVVVAGETASTASVLRGRGVNQIGDGTFEFWFSVRVPGAGFDVAVADFNRDGYPDFATADYDAHTVTVFRGPNFRGVGDHTTHSSPGFPLGVAAEDFNHDGYPDLVVAAAGSGGSFAYFRNTGTFTTAPDGLESQVTYGPASISYGITAADLNQNGDRDILVPSLSLTTIQAVFNRCSGTGPYFLSTQVAGSGTVSRNPDAAFYDAGTLVELTAVPAPGWEFRQWTGGASGSANPTTVTMNHDVYVTATFVRIQVTLQVSTAGHGQGTVVVSPAQATYDLGSTVRLTASPLEDNFFAGWSGDANGNTNPLDLLMDGNKSVTATFGSDSTLGARIVSVTDVPLDQGGAVKLRWLASSLEVPGIDPERIVTRYLVWRRGATLTSAQGDLEPPWELLAELPAGRLRGYSYVAATTSDSTTSGNPPTAFMVQARNPSGTRWFNSPPDSGYSVDNLPPTTPGPIVAMFGASENRFHWGTSRAPDLFSYRVHRGPDRDFVPSQANLVGTPTETTFVDTAPVGSFYRFAAADVHGNLSRYVLVSPDGPVATLASLVHAEARDDRIALTWYVSEPGLAATVYRRTDDTYWSKVAGLHADGSGFLRYEDVGVERGRRYGYRLGILDGGEEVFLAEHWVLAAPLGFALERVIPNPAPDGRLNVQLVVPNTSPATLELLDLNGRRLAMRQFSGLSGRIRVALHADRRLRSGYYFIRLRHGGLEQSIRAVVVE